MASSPSSADCRLPTIAHDDYDSLGNEQDEKSSLLQRDESKASSSLVEWVRWFGPPLAAVICLVAVFVAIHKGVRTMNSNVEDAIELYPLTNKPQSDKRLYHHHTMPNGLQVVSVQDDSSHQMAMAVAVRAGSFDDPAELPGLAHFCEHMLFLGTAKYPGHSDFDAFLTEYGGSSNAYTAAEVTVYFASASQAAAEKGLDRLADFFRAPLFKEEYVKKEVQAINSEHEKNVQSNGRRIMELLNFQANPKSVVPRFATGNIETLYENPKRNGSSPVDALKTYFKSRYCPAQMKLVTFGPRPLAEQLQLVKKAGFGDIPTADDACTTSKRSFATPPPFPPASMGRSMLVAGTEATGQLWLHFELPDLSSKYKGQPLAYLDYVLKYAGKNSLYRVLSDSLGLINNLITEEDPSSAGTSFFLVLYMTKFGFNRSEVALDVVFSYLASLRSAGVDPALYESLQDMVKLEWDWQQPSDPEGTAAGLAEAMTRLPREDLLSGDSLIEEPDPKLVTTLINMLQPSNMNLVRVAPSDLGSRPLEAIASTSPMRTLPHYGVKYVQQTLDEAMPGAAERWTGWLQGGLSSEALGEELYHRIQAAGVAAGSNSTHEPAKCGGLVLPPRIPEAIEGIPKHISLKNMHVPSLKGAEATVLRGSRDVAGQQGGSSADEEVADQIFGPTPVRVDLDLQATENLGALALKSSASGQDVWFRSGWVTNSPKVTMAVSLRLLEAPDAREVTAFDSVRLGIYNRLLMEEIGPELFDLTAAGSSYDLSVTPKGIGIRFDGYEEALPHLISKVLTAFNRFNEDLNATQPARFDRIVKSLREELETYDSMPADYAQQDFSKLLRRGEHSQSESLAALDRGVGLDAARRAAGELLLSKDLQITALAMGNLGDLQATEALHSIAASLKRPSWVQPLSSHADESVMKVHRVVNPSVPVEVRAVNPRPGDPNDVALVTLLYGVSDVQSRVILGIVSDVLSTAAFQNLRTERQLGYVVTAGIGMTSNVLYAMGLVQGTKLRADAAEAAIEGLFTTIMPGILRNLTQQDFERQVDAFRQQVLEPPLGKSQEVGHFWEHIKEGGKCMHLLDEVLSFLNSPRCSKELLVETWDHLVFGQSSGGPQNEGDVTGTASGPMRKKVSVKYFARSSKSEAAASNHSAIAHAELAQQRPSLEEARQLWVDQGVGATAVELLSREWQSAKVVRKANSKVRADLAQEGGYFPTDLHCGASQSDSLAEQQVVMRQGRQRQVVSSFGAAAVGQSVLHAQGVGKGLRLLPGRP